MPAIRTFAVPVTSAGAGPRVTGRGEPDADDRTARGLSPRGQAIYKKLRKRNFPHERAHAFARRAQNKVGSR